MLNRKSWSDIFSPSNVWGVLQWAFPTATAAMTAWVTYVAVHQPHIVLMFGMMTWAAGFIIVDLAKKNSAFNKINVETFQPVHYLFNEDDNIAMVQYKTIFRSEHDEPIFFDTEVLSFALQNRTNQEPRTGDGKATLLPPHGRSSFLLPMLEGIRLGEVKGRLHLRVCYGKDRAALKYVMEFRYLFQGMMFKNAEGKAGIALNTVLEKFESK